MSHSLSIEERLSCETVQFAPMFINGSCMLEHWCGVRVSEVAYRREPDVADRAVMAYVATLSPQVREERRALFRAYLEAHLFLADVWEWLGDEIRQDGGGIDAQEKYIRPSSEGWPIPVQLTDRVPQALRYEFARSMHAIAAWQQLVEQLRLQIRVQTDPCGAVTACVVEEGAS